MFLLTPAARKLAEDRLGVAKDAKAADVLKALHKGVSDGVISKADLKATQAKSATPAPAPVAPPSAGSAKFMAGAAAGAPANAEPAPASVVTVKTAGDQYEKSTKEVVFPKGHTNAGKSAKIGGHTINELSEYDKAVSGAFWKFTVRQACKEAGVSPPAWSALTKHDRELLCHAAENAKWIGVHSTKTLSDDRALDAAGEHSPIRRRRLTSEERDYAKAVFMGKAIGDDVDSGGIYMSPVAFDDAVITYPLLYGQIAPDVDIRDTDRRRVQRPIMSPITFQSGPAGTSQATVFDTAGLISNFEVPITRATAAIELDLDLEADSPVNIGSVVVDYLGQASLSYLDFVFYAGNGVSEPLGIKRTPGAAVVPSTFGLGGPFTLSDVRALRESVPTNYRRNGNSKWKMVMSDLTRAKLLGIPVGQHDTRPVFGYHQSEEDSYKFDGADVRIVNGYNGVEIPTGEISWADLSKYQAYRRLDRQVVIDTSGRQLVLGNKRLILYRQRWGGQMQLAGYVQVMPDGDQT